MILKVSPSTLSGSVQAPSSKSLSIRLIAASLLANTPSKLLNISECDDCTHALGLAAGLGAESVDCQQWRFSAYCASPCAHR